LDQGSVHESASRGAAWLTAQTRRRGDP